MPLTISGIKNTVIYRHTVTVTDENGEEKEFELSFQPDDGYGTEVLIGKTPDGGTVIAYLVRDEDCPNPLTDFEGMGKIYDRRSRYADAESLRNFREAVGIDEEGERTGKPNPYAVLLDVYEHSGTAWSIRGEGMNCQWDTSRGAGVWVPDDSCQEHIDSEVFTPEGVTISYKQQGEKINIITVTMPDGTEHFPYKSFTSAARAAAKRLGVKMTPEVRKRRLEAESEKCARNTVEEYNKWLSGDCWGTVIEFFDAEGGLLDDKCDSCYGRIGSEYAMEELRDDFKRYTEA